METELKFHFSPGDLVVIKDWDEMEMEYGLESDGTIKVQHSFVKDMRYLCGKVARIRKVSDIYGDVSLDFIDDVPKSQQWSYSTQMIRPFLQSTKVLEANIADVESLWF